MIFQETISSSESLSRKTIFPFLFHILLENEIMFQFSNNDFRSVNFILKFIARIDAIQLLVGEIDGWVAIHRLKSRKPN